MLGFIKRILRTCYRKLFRARLKVGLLCGFLGEAWRFLILTIRHNASCGTTRDIEKFQYTILRQNHVIEKGMSMRNPRKGFGREKVGNLIGSLSVYFDLYGEADKGFLVYPLGTIKKYFDYMDETGFCVDDIKRQYSELVAKVQPLALESSAGVESVTKDEIVHAAKGDFRSLLYSRHSMRYFSGESVGREKILEALELAQRTPSACNRQGWKTHVFEGEESVRLIKWQGGCHGFEDELRQSVLVTANLKAFMSYEVHQAYVDGGLYAMNLINAFHYLGLGGIPLSCGFGSSKLKGLADFGIPENEVPILIYAFGNMPETFKVAVSTRKDITRTNTFHLV